MGLGTFACRFWCHFLWHSWSMETLGNYKTYDIYTWIAGGSKTLLRTSCFSLTQLNARCCLSAWQFPRKFKDMKWKIAWRCVGKNPANSPGGPVSVQHLLVITCPSSQSLNTSRVCEFPAWWLFTSLLCFQWSVSNWVISFEALTNLTTSQPLLSSKPSVWMHFSTKLDTDTTLKDSSNRILFPSKVWGASSPKVTHRVI